MALEISIANKNIYRHLCLWGTVFSSFCRTLTGGMKTLLPLTSPDSVSRSPVNRFGGFVNKSPVVEFLWYLTEVWARPYQLCITCSLARNYQPRRCLPEKPSDVKMRVVFVSPPPLIQIHLVRGKAYCLSVCSSHTFFLETAIPTDTKFEQGNVNFSLTEYIVMLVIKRKVLLLTLVAKCRSRSGQRI